MPFDINTALGTGDSTELTPYQSDRQRRLQELNALTSKWDARQPELRQTGVNEEVAKASPYGVATPALEVLDPIASLASGMVTSLSPFSEYLHSRLRNLTGPKGMEDTRGYKEFMDAAKERAGGETYQPRTASGAALTSIASTPFWLAEKAGEIQEKAVRDAGYGDNIAAIAKDVFTFATITAMGKAGHALAPTAKARLGKYLDIVKENGPASTEAIDAAKNLHETVVGKPKAAEELATSQSELVRPDALWEAYQQGKTTLPGGTNELALKIAERLKRPAHNIPLTREQFDAMLPEVDTLRAESQLAKESTQQYTQRVNKYFADLKTRLTQQTAEVAPENWQEVSSTEIKTRDAVSVARKELEELSKNPEPGYRYRMESSGPRNARIIREQYKGPLRTISEENAPTPPEPTHKDYGVVANFDLSRLGERTTDGNIIGLQPGAELTLIDGSKVQAGLFPSNLPAANQGIQLADGNFIEAGAIRSFKNTHTLGTVDISVKSTPAPTEPPTVVSAVQGVTPTTTESVGAAPTQVELTPIQQSIQSIFTEGTDPKVRMQAIADVKAEARKGLKQNEATAVGLRKLGFTDEQIKATEKDFRNVRAARIKPVEGGAVSTEGSDVATQIAQLETQIQEQIGIRTALEKQIQDDPGGAPLSLFKKVEDTAEKIRLLTKRQVGLEKKLPAESAPDVVRPGDEPLIPAETARTNYKTSANLADLTNTLTSGVTEGTPESTIAPLQVRASGTKPNAILYDTTGLNTQLSLEQIDQQVASGRMSPEIAEFNKRQLQRQADMAGVDIADAHNFTGEALEKRLQQIASDNGLELYRAKKVKGELVYEKVSADELSAGDKLSRIVPDAPDLTKAEATSHIAKGTEDIGADVVQQIFDKLDRGEDITGQYSERISDHILDMLERRQRALETNEPADYSDILGKLKDLLGDEAGAIDPAKLNQLQKDALAFLAVQANRVGANILDALGKIPRARPHIPLFEEYLKSLTLPEPSDALTPRNTRITEANAGDKVAKHRSINLAQDAIPVWESEKNVFQNARNITRGMLNSLENPGRWLQRAGLYDPVMYAYRTAEQRSSQMFNTLRKDLNSMSREFDSYSRERIGAYGISQDTDGMRILNRMGVKVPTLSPREMEAYNAIRGIYEDFFQQINEVRQSIGQQPLNHVPNYFTRMRTFSAMERLGVTGNLISDSARVIEKRFSSYADTPFPYEKLRTKANYSAQLDAFKLLGTYGRSASRQIHMAPFVAKIHELIDTKLPDPITGKLDWEFKTKKPDTYSMMRDWIDFVATGQSEWYKLPTVYDKALKVLSNNLVYSMLSGTIRSGLVQTATIRNTYQSLGFKYTLKGIEDIMSDVVKGTSNREEAYRLSKHLDVRKMDAYQNDIANAFAGLNVRDFARVIGQGRIGEAQRAIANIGLKPLEYLDQQAALYTWRGAFRHAKEVLSKTDGKFASDKWAARYADDIVIKTQGSAMPGDLASIQRSNLGRAVTQFQTFVISDFNFLMKDVLGIGEATKLTPKQIAVNVTRFLGATFAINTLMDVVHLQSPFPTPIADVRKPLDPDQNAALQIAGRLVASGAELLPVVGSLRYGRGVGGPALEITRDVARSFRGDPLSPPISESLAKVAGVPGTQQYSKYRRARVRGENVYDSLLGWYTQGGTTGGGSRSSSSAR